MASLLHEQSIILPSIHEMFPEHLMGDPRHSRMKRISSQRPMMPVITSYDPATSPSMSPRKRHSTTTDTRLYASYPANGPDVQTKSRHSEPLSHHSIIHKDSINISPYPQTRKHQSMSPIFSFDVLRSDPSSSSLQHIASSATYPNRGGNSTSCCPPIEVPNGSAPTFKVSVVEQRSGSRSASMSGQPRNDLIATPRKSEPANSRTAGSGYPSFISFAVSGTTDSVQSARDHSPDDPELASDGDLSGSNNGKKHVCLTCQKRFNRPSSLRIHVNTHTGATPFRCPWPNCAREFNVNSNMRRHYRNHTTPGFSRPQNVDSRRRRKQGSTRGLVFVAGDPQSEVHPRNSNPYNTPPISSLSMNDDSDDVSDASEEDELDSLPDDSPIYGNNSPTYPGSNGYSDKMGYDSRASYSRYSQSDIRSGHSNHFTPPSSASPPLHRDHIYSPSAPYSRSIADCKVSTALRPAFHSKPV